MATRSSQTTAHGTWAFVKLVPLMIMVMKEGIYEKKLDWRVGRNRPRRNIETTISIQIVKIA
jgi:hypothetical protein